MKSKYIGTKWVDYWSSHPLLNSKLGDILPSIRVSDEKEVISWIQNGVPSVSNSIIDLLAKKLKKTVYAVILNPDVDASKFNEIISEVTSVESYFLKVGENLPGFQKKLDEFEYSRVKKVWQSGECSIIGDVVTVWPFGGNCPVRIELFGDTIEKISQLDQESRRETASLDRVTLYSSMSVSKRKNNHSDINRAVNVRIMSEIVVAGAEYEERLKIPLIFSNITPFADEVDFEFNQIKFDFQPSDRDIDDFKLKIQDGWSVVLVVDKNIEKARGIQVGVPGIKLIEDQLDQGFFSRELKLVVLTDRELWGTLHLAGTRHGDKFSDVILKEINPGDYVVHEDHGVAVYSGVERIENILSDGRKEIVQYVELKYAQKDRLLVPFSQLKKISKYIGVGHRRPVLTRLGGGEWMRIKSRVQKSVKKLAAELLQIYAARELTKIKETVYSEAELRSFENDFEFVETEDQLKVLEEIRSDLSGNNPMDRLLVGDVGFGKTEVAMRTAFMTVLSGRQVAVLAPTTILVEQHYHVFKDRMEKYGMKVASLSRLSKKADQAPTLNGIKTGKIDVVIGTHRLLSKDIAFKNLGLLVIDEEQKFGVAQKEKLKQLRLDVHILSMTATPIPRTLNMALTGIRDISIISVPPAGRIAIKNVVKRFDWSAVANVVRNEIKRGGQAYYVHNRVETIGFIRDKLAEILPEVRVGVAHGQMPSEILSTVMRDFNEERYDVLLCTTIIENGLDMPNVNTLIVDRAEMFGLAQLYQLRGRIGRGSVQAYAYFLYHGGTGERVIKRGYEEKELANMDVGGLKKESVNADDTDKGMLWDNARMRLSAIKELESLGSGFNLAQRDMEIRGAGNFLGREQHGNVAAVGFGLYCQLLSEMVEKIKGKDFGN